MPSLHVLQKREEIDTARLTGKVVVVLDVLFATTTIVDALARGAICVYPVRTPAEAIETANRLDAALLAGEHMARMIPGFQAASPIALAKAGLRGAQLVYCTTNGTQALASVTAVAGVDVYAGALLNGKALAAHIVARHGGLSILLACSGSVDRFNLEDFHGAGHIMAHLLKLQDYELTDASLAALHAYRGCDTRTALFASRVGRMMVEHGLEAEVEYACQSDSVDVVPQWIDGRIVDASLMLEAA